jgi:predicted ATPase
LSRLVEVISLRDLQPAGTAAMIAAYFGPGNVPADLAALIHARTEGNPFFVEEVLKALIESGAVRCTGHGWEYTAIGPPAVPMSVRAVVRQRTNRLPPPAQELLALASVLGQEFEVDVLVAAAGGDADQVLGQVEDSLAGGVLEERRLGRQETYAFTHALIGQTLYDDLSVLRRRRLHVLAAAALEQCYAGRPERAQDIARHFLAAGDNSRGGHYAALAGNHAAALYALREALMHYETAIAALDPAADDERSAAVYHARARVLDLVGRYDEAAEDFTAALRLYERRGETVPQALIYRDLFWIRQHSGGAAYAERALALWPSDREDGDLAVVLVWGAWIRVTHGDLAGAAPIRARASAMVARQGDSVSKALAAHGLHVMSANT